MIKFSYLRMKLKIISVGQSILVFAWHLKLQRESKQESPWKCNWVSVNSVCGAMFDETDKCFGNAGFGFLRSCSFFMTENDFSPTTRKQFAVYWSYRITRVAVLICNITLFSSFLSLKYCIRYLSLIDWCPVGQPSEPIHTVGDLNVAGLVLYPSIKVVILAFKTVSRIQIVLKKIELRL